MTIKKLKDGGWLILGLIGILWFWLYYPSQHPYKLLDSKIDQKQVNRLAQEQLQQWGYDASNYSIEVSLRQNSDLMNDFQMAVGRQEMFSRYSSVNSHKLPPLYYWRASMRSEEVEKKKDTNIVIGDGEQAEDLDDDFYIHFTQDGIPLTFHNKEHLIPRRTVNREILSKMGVLGKEEGEFPADSQLTKLLYFDIGYAGPSERTQGQDRKTPSDTLRSLLAQGKQVPLGWHEAGQMAQAHLSKFSWDSSEFTVDTVFVPDYKQLRAARVELSKMEPVMGQQIRLGMAIAPTGALLHVDADYQEAENGVASGESNLWEVVRLAMIVITSVFVLILFYRRLKIKVIDTKSSLAVALIGGLLVAIQAFLFFFNQITLEEAGSIWEYLMIFGVMVGLTGAVATLSAFVLAGVGESLTRQAWSSKLSVFDLVRQGLLLNKPVGFAILRSVLVAFILAGFWTIYLQLSPMTGIEMSPSIKGKIFYKGNFNFPFTYVIVKNGWLSLLSILLVYATIGSSMYQKSGRSWLVIPLTALAIALLPLLPLNVLPPLHDVLGALLIGAILAVVFYKWDVITTIASLFLFLMLLNLDSAWIPADSPDAMLLTVFAGILILYVSFGVWAVAKGKPQQNLPDFVPDYVEELAREERMKQELEIAHRVQQNFLPLETPELEGLDTAAVCKPAYETGGDYYDFIPIDDHKVAIAIGDVSGKGIEAAFYMTFIKGVLHSLCHEIDSPAMLLQKANRLFYQNAPRGTFISMVYGIIDQEKNSFRFARAGHNPILFKDGGDDQMKILKPAGLGLGMNKGETFDDVIEEKELFFDSGDILILYTDGMVEAVNQEREFYGNEQFMDTLNEFCRLPAKEMIRNTTDRLETFMSDMNQYDDMTMIVIKKR